MEGVAEQSIIGLAAGLAFEKFRPYVNTIATFITRRCWPLFLAIFPIWLIISAKCGDAPPKFSSIVELSKEDAGKIIMDAREPWFNQE